MTTPKSGQVQPQWHEHDKRVDRWRPHRATLDLLLSANDCLGEQPLPESLLLPRPSAVPMLLVCGTPRSGTTLTLQILSNAFQLTYPDNVGARLWGAPHVAVAVSRSLRHQMGVDAVSYESQAGITSDIFGPHDYAYFWERFFPFGENAWLPREAMAQADDRRLNDELITMWRAGGEVPLLFRGIIFTINADYFSRIFPGALFIDLRRNLADVGTSMLKMRKARYGSDEDWWGSAPPERHALEGQCPEVQVAGQIHHLRRRMDDALSQLPPERTLSLNYEELCADVPAALDRIAAAAAALGMGLERRANAQVPACFDVRRPDRTTAQWQTLERLFAAYAQSPEMPCVTL